MVFAMDDEVIILCTYAGETAVTTISEHWSYNELLEFVVGRWPSINRDNLPLSYKINGYNKCMLDSQDDFICMFSLAKKMQLDCIDVCVLVMGMDRDTTDEVSVGKFNDVQGLQIVQLSYVEPNFCCHKQRVLMGSQWVHEIHGVGQKFEGGAEEYRKALCKYAVEMGFNFRLRQK